MAGARRVVVHGRVQGVWFRESTRREADSVGVSGWVRNNADGTVEAWFEGDADPVDALVMYVRRGPRRASVERVEVFEEEPAGFAGFEVR
jgi:acylphosphatase